VCKDARVHCFIDLDCGQINDRCRIAPTLD
jgi:hypothetical protein